MSLPQTLLRALYVYTTEKDLPIRLLQFLLIRETLHVCLLVCVCVFVIYLSICYLLSHKGYLILLTQLVGVCWGPKEVQFL